jgi:hypothetical protein
MRVPGNLIASRTTFTLALEDFDVRGMQGIVGARVAEMIKVDVSFFATDTLPAM